MFDTLTYEGWLAIKASYIDTPHRTKLSGRLTKGKPRLERDEVAVKLSFELPESLFKKPALAARIKVDESDASSPEIDLEVMDTAEEVLRDRTGFDIKIVQEGQ